MNYAVILSGGTGSRVKGIDVPKQYYIVEEKPVISYCLETISKVKSIERFIIVAAAEWHNFIIEHLPNHECQEKFAGFAKPGLNRQMSIYNGLCVIKENINDEDVVVIHDAARPLVSSELLEECVYEAKKADGAMPVLPMKDTLYFSKEGNKIDTLLERSSIYAGQAPEAFKYLKYMRANEALLPQRILKINGSTEPAIKAGMNISLIDGEESNFKITTDEDLGRFRDIIEKKSPVSGIRSK